MSSVEAMDVMTDDLNPLTPVNTFHASDMLLLRSMLDSRHHRNMTCEEVVDVLHGANNHTAEQWARYLLHHIRTVDLNPHAEGPIVVSQFSAPSQSVRTVKSVPSRRSTTLVNHNQPQAASSLISREHSPSSISVMYTDTGVQRSTRSRRRRARTEDDDNVITGRVAHAEGPSHSSRASTPASVSQTSSRPREKYTKQDTEFLTRLRRRMIRKNPGVSIKAIAQEAAKQVPRHSDKSWYSYIVKHHPRQPALSQTAAVQSLNDTTSDANSSDDHQPMPQQITPKAQKVSQPVIEESMRIVVDPPAPDLPGDATEDEKNMGEPWAKYNGPDQRVLARYIATHPEWHTRSITENCQAFYEKYRVRSTTAWAVYYRKYKEHIDTLASGMRLQERSDSKGKGRKASSSTQI